MVQLVYCLKQRIKDLTGGTGADVVIDPVGGRYAEPALRALRWGGRLIHISPQPLDPVAWPPA